MTFQMFADDTKIYQAIIDVQEAHHTNLQDDLNQLQAWSRCMQRKFNPVRCKVMNIGQNNPRNPYTVVKDNGSTRTILWEEEDKYLGVIIDQDLAFSWHVQPQVNKANTTLSRLSHQSYTSQVARGKQHMTRYLQSDVACFLQGTPPYFPSRSLLPIA